MNRISNKIRNMSFVASLMVVSIHISQTSIHGSPAWWLQEFTKRSICCMAVPFFFVCSGYFLAKKYNYKEAIRKRVESILLPYLLWSLIFVVFSKTLQIIANIRANRMLFDNVFVPEQMWTWFGLNPTVHPYCVPYWYMRTLFLLVLISPIIITFVKRKPYLLLTAEYILLLAEVPALYCLQWTAIFYFSVGIALQVYYPDIVVSRRLITYSFIVSIPLVLSTVWGHYYGWGLADYSSHLMIPFLLIVFWGIVPSASWPIIITRSSFAIYIIHIFFVCIIGIFLPKLIESVFGIFLYWAIAAVLPMLF